MFCASMENKENYTENSNKDGETKWISNTIYLMMLFHSSYFVSSPPSPQPLQARETEIGHFEWSEMENNVLRPLSW